VAFEYALVYGTVVAPVIFGIIFLAQLLWIWHSVVDFTRDGARYAATHCWMGSGDNVVGYMRTHVPLMIDRDQFQTGGAEITVSYYSRDPASGELVDFTCENSECTPGCVPDAVTVSVGGYEFRRFVTYLGLPAVPLPDFHTSMPMESAGCDPEQGICVP
jgi:hypothetical protein